VDTHTVSDQVCLNLNVFLRNATQAGMVLSFMFAASWRLTVVTFILIPVVLLISKVGVPKGGGWGAGGGRGQQAGWQVQGVTGLPPCCFAVLCCTVVTC
jgi:ABC-type multidrug transport system fused ATPase/permease subunit